MKGAVAAVLATVMAPFLAIGLLAGAYATSRADSGGCPNAANSASTGSGRSCGPAGGQGPAAAFHGTDRLVNDPTSTGRITQRMLHVYTEVGRVFGGWTWGITCWDPHAWNPTSDHPLGRACDFTIGHIGRFPTTEQRTVGWRLARWAQTNAAALGISYIIFDGHIWSATRSREGWRHYNGGGIYDPTSVTGGHHDHAHISVTA
jgi:hypothetical protein